MDTIIALLTVFAIFTGPIFALQIQKKLDERKDRKQRRFWVFRSLMVTRGTGLSPVHVEALNAIDIEFSGTDHNDKLVREKWKEYLDHLSVKPPEKASDDWWNSNNRKTEELLAGLLKQISIAVGYDFDVTHIKRAAYVPTFFHNFELENNFVRKSLVELFLGKRSFPVELTNGGADSETIKKQNDVWDAIIAHHRDGKPINVVLKKPDEG